MRPILARRGFNGFVLLEVMLAVGIFATGVIALGYSVNNCLNAEIARTDDQRARLALENRMAEIEAGAVSLDSESETEQLKGSFEGMSLKQTRKPFTQKNEKDEVLDGIYVIDLEVSWRGGNQTQSKVLSFYVFQTR